MPESIAERTRTAAAERRRFRWPGPNLALGLMLLVLHIGLIVGVESAPSRAFLLAHFGLFLLWQPLWQGAHKLHAGRALLIVTGGALLAWWSNWWLVALWIAVLFSLIGGNVPGMRELRPRLAPLLAALYLLSILLVWVVPHLIESFDGQPAIALAVRYLLAIPLIVILVMPGDAGSEAPRQAVDLVYSVMLFLLVVVLVLGALFIQRVTRSDYAIALVQTVIGIAILMFILSWLWDPRGGFDGIGQLLSRYFLSLGMPFERWMYSLANLADSEVDPDDFVEKACREILSLTWISAVEWRARGREGSVGVPTTHVTRFEFGGLDLRLHSKWRPGPGMVVHMRLLARLLGDYHDAKVREQAQRDTAYLQAIYETGSRVTHDVKNLLQSLRSLCAAAEQGGDSENAEALRGLIKRQLPQIAYRLQITLGKLEAGKAASGDSEGAVEWWRGLNQRYGHERVEFVLQGVGAAHRVPSDLFDSVGNNLVQNAVEKRRRGDAGSISVLLEDAGHGRCRLAVSDTGNPIPERLAKTLFVSPVRSEYGLGVGLYQGSRQASEQGYRLVLASNEPGRVSFVLEPVRGLAEEGTAAGHPLRPGD
ncbi:MAG: sensor histidine kinase [Betaproteobacteria bacterium]|nr:sensor histidine kinase [Betaproteobacteria bacterium]